MLLVCGKVVDMKITVVVNATDGVTYFAAQIAMDITGMDDIGSPPLPFEQIVKENAAEFGSLIAGFIVDKHPTIATEDLTQISVYGEEIVQYSLDNSPGE